MPYSVFLHDNDLDFPRKIAEKELANLSVNDRTTLRARIAQVFTLWKLDHGQENRGLLAKYKPGATPAEMQPWDCAGIMVQNPIDLLLMLWIDGYGPLMEERKTDAGVVIQMLALLVLEYATPESYLSVRRATDIICQYREELQKGRIAVLERSNSELFKAASIGMRARKNLRIGPKRSAIQKSRRAAERHGRWQTLAADVWKKFPLWSVEKVVDYIQQQDRRFNQTFSARTISRAIAGVRKTALAKAEY